MLAKKSKDELAEFLISWAKNYNGELHDIYTENQAVLKEVLDIGRSGNKPRKDLVCASQIANHIGYFFDETYKIEDKLPESISTKDARMILEDYLEFYNFSDDNSLWFERIKEYADKEGYAVKMKEYKKSPELFKGSIADLTSVLRIAITGRQNAPDLWAVQQLLGLEKVKERIIKYTDYLS